MGHRSHSKAFSLTRLGMLTLGALAVLLVQLTCGGTRTVTEAVGGDWITVYYTSPHYPDDPASHHGGMDEKLVSAIDDAVTSIDLVAYDLDLASVTDAVVAAHQRGVQVRLIIESDNASQKTAGVLQQAGITLVEDERGGGLMHHKFAVIDGQRVWTGSWNLTENGTYRNNNNAVLVNSTALAENYAAEFAEMFAGHFGPASPANTPNPLAVINVESDSQQHRQVRVQNYFAPEDDVARHIIAEISGAQRSIRFLAFAFTSDQIADAMLERAQAGVTVEGVMESRNAKQPYSEYERLRLAAHRVLLDGNPYIMHHKVIIVDQSTVILGSYNFTASAEDRNDENVLIIHDAEVAASFMTEFNRICEQARTAH